MELLSAVTGSLGYAHLPAHLGHERANPHYAKGKRDLLACELRLLHLQSPPLKPAPILPESSPSNRMHSARQGYATIALKSYDSSKRAVQSEFAKTSAACYLSEMLIKAPSTQKNQAWDFHRDYLSNQLFPLAKSDQAVVVYGCDDEMLPLDVADLIDSFDKPVLLHLSDETLVHRTEYYSDARAVFRPYYDPRIRGTNVWFLPLGYVNGYANDLCTIQRDRPIKWVFAGQAKGHRGEMLGQLSLIAPNYIHLTTGWLSSDGLGPSELIELYKQSIFAPCPFGNLHPDTLRICEALEWGCLPVTVKFMGTDYFRYIFGDHPFLVARDWVDAALQMKALLAEPDKLAERQKMTADWYATFKKNLALDMADILAGRTKNLRCSQFSYQRAGQVSRMLRIKFELYFGHGILARRYRLELRKFASRAARYS